MKHVAFCASVRNCAPFLSFIFKNIESVITLNKYTISCVFVYDNCSDSTGKILKKYADESKHKVIVTQIENNSIQRTVRISKARNKCLDIIYNDLQDVDYHIMFDADDVNQHQWNIDTLCKYIDSEDSTWDSMTFNRKSYYDTWPVLVDHITHHEHGIKGCDRYVCRHIIKYIKQKIKKCKSDSFYVNSAFNGLGIYKTPSFKGIRDVGLYKDVADMYTDEERSSYLKVLHSKMRNPNLTISTNPNDECCEHIYYNLTASLHNKCRHKISVFNV